MNLPRFYIDELIKTALKEDINYIDVATDLLTDDGSLSNAHLLSKADGVLAGVDVACRVFELMDDSVEINKSLHDGDQIKAGDIIATFHGKTAALLKSERTALNILRHMSGIATYTSKCVREVAGVNPKAKLTDTRKTLPGLRALQKYAVVCGGGFNHRFNLSDAAMLKNNHIDAYGGVTAAVEALRARIGHTVSIEVEVRDFDELKAALDCGVGIIMLDNMSINDMTAAVKLAKEHKNTALLEASGNITLDTLRKVAQTGVDIISMGALTYGAGELDVSFRVEKIKNHG